ncbi:uncharacterized protein V6R79_006257 [Siganus canaliculatus]
MSRRYQWAEDDFDPPRGAVWMGRSAPVDDKVYVMYHGTTSKNARLILATGFQQSSGGMLGPGVYLSRDLDKASRYPIDHPEHDRVVIKVVVNVGRVKKIDRQHHPLQKTWHDHGYDTAWVPPNCGMVKSGLEEDCVWDPSRITVIGTIRPKPVQYGAYGYIFVVSVGRVISINYQGHPLQKTWHNYGYDTAWVPPYCGVVKSGLEEDCVWDPSCIKVIGFIKPQPIPYGAYGPYGAHGYIDINMSQRYQWAEDDFDPPRGAVWMGCSAPVDDQIYVMYHGTTSRNAQMILARGFQRSSDGMLGPGVYLSRDLNKASRYPINHPEHDRVVIKVVVDVGRVKKIDRQRHRLQKTWHDHGYDTAWVPPNCGMVKSGLEEDCVWDPSRIQIIDTIRPKPVQYGAYGHM